MEVMPGVNNSAAVAIETTIRWLRRVSAKADVLDLSLNA
jgi:hypothetical protein